MSGGKSAIIGCLLLLLWPGVLLAESSLSEVKPELLKSTIIKNAQTHAVIRVPLKNIGETMESAADQFPSMRGGLSAAWQEIQVLQLEFQEQWLNEVLMHALHLKNLNEVHPDGAVIWSTVLASQWGNQREKNTLRGFEDHRVQLNVTNLLWYHFHFFNVARELVEKHNTSLIEKFREFHTLCSGCEPGSLEFQKALEQTLPEMISFHKEMRQPRDKSPCASLMEMEWY